MINMENLLNMQGMMLIMVLIGMLFSKKDIITKEGRKCLTDLTINILIPCNMIAAFIKADRSMFSSMAGIMFISLLIQIFQYVLSKILYRKKKEQIRSVLRYSTMVSNAGFLGNPMVEGMYGQSGLVLASVFLVPVRLFYWSVGLACFIPVDRKNVVKTALTHPCIIAVLVGLLYMFFPVPLPVFVEKTIMGFSTAMTPVTMLLIGSILGDVDLKTIISKDTLYISLIRLVTIPAIIFLAVKAAGVEPLMASVTVILISMPVATTTAILASRYDGDAEFATKTVVLTTILSLVTIPVWSLIVEHLL